MKLTFNFLGMTKSKALGIVRHNARVKGFYESNLVQKGKIGGIDPSRIKNNIVLTKIKSFKDDDWLGDVKVAGGRQKISQEFTGWVIQVGGINNEEKKLDTLPKQQNIKFLKEAHKWIENYFGKDSVMASVIQLDETTPQLQLVMNNKSIDKNTGKVYISSKRKFGFVGLTKHQVREKSKNLMMQFYDEVASKYGIEAPSKELGTRGKVSKNEFVLEKQMEQLKKQNEILAEKEKEVKIFDAFAANNKNSNAIALKMVKVLEKYNPKAAKAAKAALVGKTLNSQQKLKK